MAKRRRYFAELKVKVALKDASIKISNDGKARGMDIIFIEKLWQSLKYESVCHFEVITGTQARKVIGRWIRCHNDQRPHSLLGDQTPTEAYWNLAIGSSLGTYPERIPNGYTA